MAAGVVAGALAAGWLLGWALSPWARQAAIGALENRFASQVEVSDLQVRLGPFISVDGRGLVFRHHGRRDVPPLIRIGHFRAETNLVALLALRITEVRLEGLEITMARGEPERETAGPPTKRSGTGSSLLAGAVASRVIADGTTLVILPKDRGKDPLTFHLRKLTLSHVSGKTPLRFQATLTNPKPPGNIETEGEFGPWDKESPRNTAVSGRYVFRNANLGVFKGISGTLSSTGAYDGVLERIHVKGATDVPDFAVDVAGHPVHLKTDFDAVVDGTDGDTYLQPVDATFLNSRVVARGKVEGLPGQQGKAVILDVTVQDARMEDMIQLAVPSQSAALQGDLQFTTYFRLPPGDESVIQKLELKGQFGVADGKFAKDSVQRKLAELSNKARGKPEAAPDPEVTSNLEGAFHMRDGQIDFSRVRFAIPGAKVQLRGTYGMDGGKLDFRGHLLLAAEVSETTTGVKSFFLKLVDPLFKKKGGGASVPIRIRGTVKKPSYGLALGG